MFHAYYTREEAVTSFTRADMQARLDAATSLAEPPIALITLIVKTDSPCSSENASNF